MTRQRKSTRLFAIVASVLALVLTLQACSSNADPTSFIKKTYERNSSLDEDGIDAYVSNKSPNEVATEISADSDPYDRRQVSEEAAGSSSSGGSASTSSSSGGGDAVFLQYKNDIVAIFPYEGGSRIMLGEYRRAHTAYYGFIGGLWVSSPGAVGGGSSNRGGGSGGGK